MKQNFKIGKIFLFIIALFFVFFNCEIGFCNDDRETPSVLSSDGTITPTEEEHGMPNISGINDVIPIKSTKEPVKEPVEEGSGVQYVLEKMVVTKGSEVQYANVNGVSFEQNEGDESLSDKDNISGVSFKPNEGDESLSDKDMHDSKLDQKTELLISKQEIEQLDQKSVEDEDNSQQGKQVKVVATTEDVYFPIDISDSIFDSTVVAIKNVDNFNVENEYFGIEVGFDYDFRLKKNEENDFNKYIILNPKLLGTDNIYFSIFNYHDFFKNKHTNSEDFKKNYYTLYAKSNIDGINSVYFGASIGYIPFKGVIDDSDKNFKKYMLFASLNTDFSLMLLGNSIHFSNLLTLDFNLLRSDYLVNSNKSNEYIKIKDGMLLNYEISGLTGLFVGVDFGVYTMHREFRKNIGLNKNTECNLITGIKFEFGSINVSLGNRGVGLGLSMNY